MPGPGIYRVMLRVDLAGGAHETATRTYRLRDLLLVSIGDSFASGQGNPDVAAVPGVDQRLACEATTLWLVQDRVRQFLDDLAGEAQDRAEELARELPFVGALAAQGVAAGAAGIDAVTGLAEDLRSGAVELLRDGVGAVREGFEEGLGWVGIGDGGEAGEIQAHPARWQEPRAYRSYRSGHSLAARALERDSPAGADRVTFLSFARSGSDVPNGLLGPRTVEDGLGTVRSVDGWAGDRGQVAEAAATVAGRRIDVLLISIGINDIDFSSLVARAILKASGEKRKQRVAGARRRLLDDYPRHLEQLKAAIDRDLRPRHVLVTEYPVNVFQEIADGAKPCGVLGTYLPNPLTGKGLDLDRADARDYGELGHLLNLTIREQARRFGWTVVDGIADGFAGHGYCADDSYFVSAEQSCVGQRDFEGMLHPNHSGHAVVQDRIAAALFDRMFVGDWLEPVLHVAMS